MSSPQVYPSQISAVSDSEVQVLCCGGTYSIDWGRVYNEDGSQLDWAYFSVGAALNLYVCNDEILCVAVPVRKPDTAMPVPVMKPPNQQAQTISQEIVNAYNEGVSFYSQLVFPISLLKKDYCFTESAELSFALMETKCVGVRRCRAGGNDGMYMVLAIAIVEHLARKSTPIEELKYLQKCVCESKDSPAVTEALSRLECEKKENYGGMRWMTSQNRNADFWNQMSRFLVAHIAVYLRTQDPEVNIGGMTPEMIQLIILGDDNPDIPILVLAKAFSLRVLIFSTDSSQIKMPYATVEPGKKLAYIYLFREGNLFHILYSQAQLEVEGYNIETCRMNQQSAFPPDMSKLYFTTLKRDTIPSQMTSYIEMAQRSIERVSAFSLFVQKFIAGLFELIERRRTSTIREGEIVSSFFNDDLVNETLVMMFEYSNTLEEFKVFPGRTVDGFVDDVLQIVASAPLQSVLNRKEMFENMNACNFCHSGKGPIILDCRHSFCLPCIRRYIDGKKNEMPLLLKANGDTYEELVCPMINCFIRIPGVKLKEVIGEVEFAECLHKSEQAIGKRHCLKCKKVRIFSQFVALCPCNSAMCLLCYCESVRKSDGKCECGKSLTEQAMQQLAKMSVQCAGCLKLKSTLKEFTSVECEEHSLCEECLSRASQQDNRCSNCYRIFTYQEVSELQYLRVYKPCLFCREDCRKSRLNTLCGCVICEKCATSAAQMSNKYLNCFNCRAMLPEFGTNQLHLWTKPVAEVEMKDCPICYNKIERGQENTLPCGDAFHSACLSDFYENIIVEDSYAEDEVYCPNGMCKVMTPANDIRNFVSAEVFQKYHENFIKEHTTPCPRCQNRIPDKDDSGGKKTNILCPNCSFCFCVACKGEYDPRHDDKRCRFNKIQKLVRETEQQVEIVGGIVGQCPLCKYPSIHGEGCDSLECSNTSCKTKFCVRCSVPYYLYSIHGEAWHRPACEHYNASDRKEGMSENCRACMSKKGLCSQPPDLKVKARFDFDES